MKNVLKITKEAIEVYKNALEHHYAQYTPDQIDNIEMTIDSLEYLLRQFPVEADLVHTGEDILRFLNQVCGTKARYASENKKLINNLLEKYSPEEIKAVILCKFDEWVYTRQSKFLRPSTLFQSTERKDNFMRYLEEAEERGFVSYKNGAPVCVDKRPEASRNNVFSPHNTDPIHEIVRMIINTEGSDNLLRSLRQHPVPNQTWDALIQKHGMEKVLYAVGRMLPKTEPIPYLAKHLSNYITAITR